jgi:hypothetical protein
MKSMKKIILVLCFAGVLPLAFSQAKAPKRLTTAEAKDHVGETATVCGMAVDTQPLPRYGIANLGKPVSVDLDQAEPSPVFYFVTFSTDPHKPELVEATYKGKQVCVTGDIAMSKTTPFIMAKDHAMIKIQGDDKK